MAGVVEDIRRVWYDTYVLDRAHYLKYSPLLDDALLRLCNAPILFLTDREILVMVGKEVRGGVFFILEKRYSRANNENNPQQENQNKKVSCMYLVATNFFGSIMEKNSLPVSGFKMLDAQ